MALGPADNLMPPTHELPISDQGDHSHAWTRYNQDVADRLNGVHRGVVDGSNAKAGDVGEYLSASGGSAGIPSNVPQNVVALALPAGDWDVWGFVTFTPAAATHPLALAAGVSVVSGGFDRESSVITGTFATGTQCTLGTPGPSQFNLAGPALAYLVAQAVFTGGGMTASGTIKARRAR